jgi:hypothetical protein
MKATRIYAVIDNAGRKSKRGFKTRAAAERYVWKHDISGRIVLEDVSTLVRKVMP